MQKNIIDVYCMLMVLILPEGLSECYMYEAVTSADSQTLGLHSFQESKFLSCILLTFWTEPETTELEALNTGPARKSLAVWIVMFVCLS